MLEALRISWLAHPTGISDPTRKFTLAQNCIRKVLKSIQEQILAIEQPLDFLLSQLVQLKLDILDESNHQQRHNYEQVKKQIQEAELTKANRLHSLTQVKFLGTRDEPNPTLFVLLKEKQQREAMSILIMDEDVTIEDECKILQEVEQFYKKLCTIEGSCLDVLATREELLSFVNTRVSEEKRREIGAQPTSKEV